MPLTLSGSAIYGGLFGDEELAAILGDENEIRQMLRFEAALAEVQGALGIIQRGEALSAALTALEIPAASLGQGTAGAGVAVPALLAEVRSALPADLAAGLHWGATSQDVVDTAHVLQYRDCLDVLAGRLCSVLDALCDQSDRHAETVMAARTRGQIATSTTFGLRIAQWAHPLIDAEARLDEVRNALCRVQFGGAAGNNAVVHPHGPAIVEGLAGKLGLAAEPPWHTHRNGLALLAGWMVDLANGLAHIAKDLMLLGRSEIREASAGTGGGSSTMPHKSNPVAAEAIRTLTTLVRGGQGTLTEALAPIEERDGADWAVEWAVLPQMIIATGAALRHAGDLIATLKADAEAMSKTLADTPGALAEAASFELAKVMSRGEAKALVQQALAAGGDFAEALAARAPDGLDIHGALDPAKVIDPAEIIRQQTWDKR